MNQKTLLLACACLPLITSAQTATKTSTTNRLGQTVTVVTPSRFVKTPPMSAWPEATERDEKASEKREVDAHRPLPEVVAPQFENEPDGALQTKPASRLLRAALISVNGQSGSGVPPDPTGAAGTDRYVQAVNTAYRVYLKTGQTVGSAHNLSYLWPGSQNAGDPIVMYDRHADRWFISQFNFAPNRMLIAVSETGDPAGAYYTYEYTFSQFPDYPKFSIWWDGYYMTSNSNKTAIVFERDRMLAGDATARMVALTAPGVVNSGFTSVLPADADGDLPPAGTPCYFFNIEDNSWGAPADRIKIYEMSTDWNSTSNTGVVQSQTLNTASFDPWLGSGWNNIAQPGTSQKLDAGLGIFYYRAQHTRWSDHNSVVLCHGVDVGNQCAVRWYELRDANDGNWSIHQQGTWSPDGADRFYGSIAMDGQGNIGLGYSCADATNNVYAGLRYTGRLASDPLGEMTFAEQTVINGTGAQTGTERFGDYAHMSLDPDGQTFWFTGEYLGSGGSTRTRIFSFNLAAEVGVEENGSRNTAFDLNVTQQPGVATVNVQGAVWSATSTLEVIGMDGRQVWSQPLSTLGGIGMARIPTAALADGAWFIRVVNGDQQRVKRIVLAAAR